MQTKLQSYLNQTKTGLKSTNYSWKTIRNYLWWL